MSDKIKVCKLYEWKDGKVVRTPWYQKMVDNGCNEIVVNYNDILTGEPDRITQLKNLCVVERKYLFGLITVKSIEKR